MAMQEKRRRNHPLQLGAPRREAESSSAPTGATTTGPGRARTAGISRDLLLPVART